MVLICIRRAGSEMHTAGCAVQGGDPADAISCDGTTPSSVQCVCVCTSRGEGGFSMRACEEGNGSLLEGFSLSGGLCT